MSGIISPVASLTNGVFYLHGFPPLWYHYLMVPVAYGYSWLSSVLPAGTIAMSSLPSALDFYPSYSITVVPGLLFDFIVKIPFLVSDVLVAVLLYKLVGEATGNKRWRVSGCIVVSQSVCDLDFCWVGYVGYFAGIVFACCIVFAIKKRFAYSGVCLSLGVAAKLYPVLFLVPIVFYLYKSSGVGERWRNLRGFFGVFGVFLCCCFCLI